MRVVRFSRDSGDWKRGETAAFTDRTAARLVGDAVAVYALRPRSDDAEQAVRDDLMAAIAASEDANFIGEPR